MGMNEIRSIGRVLVVVGLAALCVPVWGQVANIDEYEQDILDWHARREEGLRRETGWFSIVGLFPLEQGTSTFGSSEESHIRFPDGAPGHAGVLELDVGDVTIVVEPGVAVFETLHYAHRKGREVQRREGARIGGLLREIGGASVGD